MCLLPCIVNRLENHSAVQPCVLYWTMIRPLNKAEDEAERLTILGAVVNVGLSASKAVSGVAARSPVLIADAAHSLSDLCTDAGVWWALMVGRRAPSRQHPEGFGKFGALSSLAISGLLLSPALSLISHRPTSFLFRSAPTPLTIQASAA